MNEDQLKRIASIITELRSFKKEQGDLLQSYESCEHYDPVVEKVAANCELLHDAISILEDLS